MLTKKICNPKKSVYVYIKKLIKFHNFINITVK